MMKVVRSRFLAGFTLIEVLLVVSILAVLATLAVNRYARVAETAKVTVAEADLQAIRTAFLAPEHGYVRDLTGLAGFSPVYLRVGNLFVATNVFGNKVVGPRVADLRTRGLRLDEGTEAQCQAEGRARPELFTSWDETRNRGWHGPYLASATGVFPAPEAVRFANDATFAARGFFPALTHLLLPDEFKDATRASVYGFVGEPTLLDPWGNPYVVQVPPPQAFAGVTNIPDAVRFDYARVVSAGPDGVLSTPCFGANTTNYWGATGWSERRRRLARQAGLIDGTDRSARGDDLVLFFTRTDLDEGESAR